MPPALSPAQPAPLAELVEYAPGAVVSRTLLASPEGGLTVFALDAGQRIWPHAAPFDAVLVVLDGRPTVTVGNRIAIPGPGEATLLPAGVPHGIEAGLRCRLLLMTLRC